MKHILVPLTLSLLVSIAFALMVLPTSQAQSNLLLSADFTGSTLPAGWSPQGSATFIGTLNPSTGIGGIQLVSTTRAEGAVYYGSPFTNQNIVIEISGAYGDASTPSYCEDADNIGVGFYSGGPSALNGQWNPASPNGYYASFEFYSGYGAALMYNAQGEGPPTGRIALGTTGLLPHCGLNYVFAETIVTPTNISMKAITRTDSPWTVEPSISLTNILTYNGAVDNSHSTLYVGGATGSSWTYQYVYWLRVLSYSTPVPEYPASLVPLVASLTLTVLAIRYRCSRIHTKAREN